MTKGWFVLGHYMFDWGKVRVDGRNKIGPYIKKISLRLRQSLQDYKVSEVKRDGNMFL